MTTIKAPIFADHSTGNYAPLRQVALEDLKSLKILEKEVFRDLAYSMDLLRTFYNLFQDTWHVVTCDDDLAGYALVGLSSNNKKGWLLGLAVSSHHRGLGLGRTLMSQALRSMMTFQAADAYLTVRPDNAAARSIYDSFGFTQVGKAVPDYYGNGEPRAVLHRSLTDNPFPLDS